MAASEGSDLVRTDSTAASECSTIDVYTACSYHPSSPMGRTSQCPTARSASLTDVEESAFTTDEEESSCSDDTPMQQGAAGRRRKVQGGPTDKSSRDGP
ncbi:unnamed protein product, partial [Mesorhabditis spiculigera]